MKILLISPKMEKPNGGIAVWTNEYLAWCEKNGVDCHVVNTAAIGTRAEDGNAKRNYLDEFKRSRDIFKQIKKALKNNSFDVVHLNSSCGTFGIIRDYFSAKIIQSKFPRLRLITHFHCDIPYQIGNPVSLYFLKKLVAVSAKNLVLCRNSQQYLKNLCGVDSTLIPNFIAKEMVATESKKISKRLKTVFYVGRVEKAKGMGELFSAARDFPEIRFELAGAVSGEMKQTVKSDNVILLGAVPHEKVLEYMDRSDMFVFPSHSEGFSVALLESMSRGLPCIATDVGANSDMLEGGCGIVVSAKDVSALKGAIEKMQSPEQRKAMSCACIEKVKNHYTLDRVMKRIIEIYSA